MTEATTNEKVTEQSPTGRRRLIQALALGLMFVVPLLLAELTVRLVFDVPSPDARRKLALRYQPALFARHIFPATRQRVDKYRINRLGYRGAEFEPAKRPGVIRVMIYGGSQVFDPFCDEEQQWPHRLQLALGALGRRDVEVINAGIPGHASFDSLGRLLTEGHRFSPDVVILDNAWNDIKGFGSRRALLRSLAPYEPKIDRRLVYANRVDRFFSRYSQLYRLLRNAYLRRTLDAGLEGRRRQGELSSTLQPSALRQYGLVIETFVDLVRNIGAHPIVMLQPRLATATLAATLRAKIRYRYTGLTHEALVRAFGETDRILRAVAKKKNVPLFEAEIDGQGELFVDHVHLTPKGSALLARKLARFLLPLLASRPRTLPGPAKPGP